MEKRVFAGQARMRLKLANPAKDAFVQRWDVRSGH